jgi:DNA (cytosine-5)-methyltransferase 1
MLSRAVGLPLGRTTAWMQPLVDTGDPERDWTISWLRGSQPSFEARLKGAVRTVDLFAGTGGLSLGTRMAIEAIGRRHVAVLAADLDADAIDVHDFNLGPRRTFLGSVRDLFDPTLLDAAPIARDVPAADVIATDWVRELGRADIIVGGPPCQGHSNLNNRTRRSDARNELYRWMALAAHGLQAKVVVIENVTSVKADAGDVVRRTIDLLRALDYTITFDDVVAADRVGVAQTRRRHFLVAVKTHLLHPNWADAATWMQASAPFTLTALDAIDDLQDVAASSEYDRPATLSKENRERVAYLHDADVFDLPNERRPECHRDGNHNYGAVYGRMYEDRPAPTLSTGFLSPGRGRYVHPTRPRTITPHEGARLQGFPDTFRFVGSSGKSPSRTAIARLVGDAVPPPLGFHVMLGALGMLCPDAFDDR